MTQVTTITIAQPHELSQNLVGERFVVVRPFISVKLLQ